MPGHVVRTTWRQVVRLIALLSFSPLCSKGRMHFTRQGSGEQRQPVCGKKKPCSFNLFESSWDIKVLARRDISDIIGVDTCKGFHKDLYERAICGRQKGVVG